MLLLTADRPYELHGCGANQTVPQAAMMAPVARLTVDVPCPEDSPDAPLHALDAVAAAWDAAHGVGGTAGPGPAHVNWRFREPLAPTPAPYELRPDAATRLSEWETSGCPWSAAQSGISTSAAPRGAADGVAAVRSGTLADLNGILSSATRAVIVAGGARSPHDAACLARIVCSLGWPVLCDITSGLRGHGAHAHVVHHADLVLCGCDHRHVDDALRPDAILRIGGRITSKRLQQWMDRVTGVGCPLAVVGDGVDPMDPSRRATVTVHASAEDLAVHLGAMSGALLHSAVCDAWVRADAAVADALAQLDVARPHEGGGGQMPHPPRETHPPQEPHPPRETHPPREPVVARVALREAQRAGAIAMLSSSMPVREADMHADRASTPWCIANRGASGIDGIVATAAGACAASGRPTLLLIGDVAALHDLSSWSLLRELPVPLCMVIVNNSGGGIFRFLPIAGHMSAYSPWFDSPHNVSFCCAAEAFGVRHIAVHSESALADAVREVLVEGATADYMPPDSTRQHAVRVHPAHVIEVRTLADRLVPDHRAVQAACASAVAESLAAGVARGGAR